MLTTCCNPAGPLLLPIPGAASLLTSHSRSRTLELTQEQTGTRATADVGGHERGGRVAAPQVPGQNASLEDRVLEPSQPQWLYLWYPRPNQLQPSMPWPTSYLWGHVTSLKGCSGLAGSLFSGTLRQSTSVAAGALYAFLLDRGSGECRKSGRWWSSAATSVLPCLYKQRMRADAGGAGLQSHPRGSPSAPGQPQMNCFFNVYF